MELQDKVVIVTGGGSGIGGAISLALAAKGAVPVILGRSALDPWFEKQLSNLQPQAMFMVTELTNKADCELAVDACIDLYGRLDGLVNNAASNDQVGLDAGVQAFMASLECNLLHYYLMVHLTVPYLRKSRGAIVNIGSKAALTGQDGTSGYCAAKGAQLALTRAWAADLSAAGIRVNAVVPDKVTTRLEARWLSSLQDSPDSSNNKLIDVMQCAGERRMITPEEVAETVISLLSEQSQHMTGQWLFMDGETHVCEPYSG